LIVGNLVEQLTKSTRHLAEFLVLARALNWTLVLPDVDENEIGMSQGEPFCLYYEVHRMGEYVDWVTHEQFLFDTRSRGNKGLTMSTVRDFVVDIRSRAFKLGYDIEWQRPQELNLGEYNWLEEGVLETDRLLGPNKPSAGALVLKQPVEFCGIRVRPWLWFRVQQLADMETVVWANEPQFGVPGALNQLLENILMIARRHLQHLDVVVGVKNRAYNLFLPKEVVNQALQYVRPIPQVSGCSSARRLRSGVNRSDAVCCSYRVCCEQARGTPESKSNETVISKSTRLGTLAADLKISSVGKKCLASGR
jgi:hypothetical protein